MEAIGATRDHPQLVVDALHRTVRHLRVQVRQDAFSVFLNRTPQLHERRQAGPRSPLQPLIEQRRRILGCRLPQDRRQVLLQFVGPVQPRFSRRNVSRRRASPGLSRAGCFSNA